MRPSSHKSNIFTTRGRRRVNDGVEPGVSKSVSQQVSKSASQQVSKSASQQVSKPASQQVSKSASQQVRRQSRMQYECALGLTILAPVSTSSQLGAARGGRGAAKGHTYIHACIQTCMHAYMHAYVHTYRKGRQRGGQGTASAFTPHARMRAHVQGMHAHVRTMALNCSASPRRRSYAASSIGHEAWYMR